MLKPSSNRAANSQAPNENEMSEVTQNSNTEGDSNTNQSEIVTSDNTLIDRQESSCSTTPQRKHIIDQLKNRFTTCRYDNPKKDENESDKNRGFLLINQADDDIVYIQNDNADQQHTRHSEPCEHGRIDEDNAHVNQAQLVPTTPITPSLSPPQPSPLAFAISPVVNRNNSHNNLDTYNEPDVQATQAGVECATPLYDESNVEDTQLSATNSYSSTNSSNNDSQWTEIDRATLSDNEYILAQKSDLERIAVYEIDGINERHEYQMCLAQIESEEFDINVRYKEEQQKNAKLLEERRRLKEEKDRIYLPWSCEICTYYNESFSKTHKDVCEMCEGPSPLKRHALTN
ncbi:unnamed protein product [Rotaria sp. Silwood1]|nr:unnamed protein product [Rotaria sp. Silwood1]